MATAMQQPQVLLNRLRKLTLAQQQPKQQSSSLAAADDSSTAGDASPATTTTTSCSAGTDASSAARAAGSAHESLVDSQTDSDDEATTATATPSPKGSKHVSCSAASVPSSTQLPAALPVGAPAPVAAECCAASPALAVSGGAKLEYYQPHDGFGKGCPAPPCFEERVSTALNIYKKMELRDGELESTLRLLCRVFDVETATVSLLTGERIFLVAACGALPVCVCPDRWGFCGWSFLNPNHELNVVENMEADARFSQNFFVVSESFRLVFYVMAPLISSNGHRVGTLCIMGQQPRKFDATRGAILANLSELLVRQIERRWALQEAAKHDGGALLRTSDAYSSAVGFVDASSVGAWQLLHLNAPAVQLLGIDWGASYDELAKLADGRHFPGWAGVELADVLQFDMSQAAWEAAQVELTVRNVPGAPGSAAAGKRFDLTFRLAAAEGLDEHAPFSVGIPSWLREASDPAPGRNFFFMHIRPASGGGSAAAAASRRSSIDSVHSSVPLSQGALVAQAGGAGAGALAYGPRLAPHASPISDLVLGPLLGKGSYGKVYRGLHKGQEVAVKIIERLDTVRVDKRGIPIEVALTQDMHHLGVARCLAWGVGKPLQEGGSPTCWMVQELCDKHTLVDAVVKGWFRTTRQPTHGGTHLRVVALTAYEVASAMAYLHSHGIAHLDLSGGNVLLTSCASNPHGFSARVTDFGLARNLDVKARTAPGRYGTITHMAPETIRDGELSVACDVYAWGVLLWEMLTGSRAWAGMAHDDILAAVHGPWTLALPPGLPPILQELLLSALSKEPAGRPTFKQMLPRLEWYLQLTRDFPMESLELPLRSSAPLE